MRRAALAAGMDRPATVRRLQLALLAVVALGALSVGPLLVAAPDGHLVGLPQGDLAGSPFHDYLVPGLLLTGLGAPHGWALVLQARRRARAWFWTGFAAAALVVWIAVQVLIIQPSFLQPLLFAFGAAEGLLALWQWRHPVLASIPAVD